MKSPFAAALFLLATLSLTAGEPDAAKLAASFESIVVAASKGDFTGASKILFTQMTKPKTDKELAEQAEQLKGLYQKLAALGEFDAVERLSYSTISDSVFLMKVAEKREGGLIVWTFAGYKYRGAWYCKGMNLNGSDDMLQLLHQEGLDGAPDRK